MKTGRKLKLDLLHVSWPIFIERITGGVVLFADTYFLSWISDTAAASVGMLGPVMLMGYFILPQFSSAGTSVASQYMGAQDDEKVVPAYVGTICITLSMGILLAILVLLFSGSIGLWLGMSNEQNLFASQYLEVIGINFIFVTLRFSYSGILSSLTLTRWNMIVSLVINCMNIFLNWALVTGVWIFPQMGVHGIALATVISFATGFLILFYLVHIHLQISFRFSHPVKRMKEVIGPILRIGLPSAIEPFSYTVQNFVVSVLIIGIGLVAMGANTFVLRILFLDLTVSWSLTTGGQIVMSHFLGAGNIRMVYATYRRILFYSMTFAGCNLAVYLIFHRQIFSIFTENPEIVTTGFWILVICLFMEPIRAVNILGGIALKTVGDGKFSAAMAIVFMWSLIPVIMIVSSLGFGIIGLWCCLLVDETVRAGINIWRWSGGTWEKRVVIRRA